MERTLRSPSSDQIPCWVRGEVVFEIESLDLVEGTYKLDVAVHTREGRPYDYHRLLHTFRVSQTRAMLGSIGRTTGGTSRRISGS